MRNLHTSAPGPTDAAAQRGERRGISDAEPNPIMVIHHVLVPCKAVVATGVPWRQILAAVGETGIDLVVVGTQRRRWLEHALLGSVAEKIVRTSPVPVLTVPPAPGTR